MAISKQEEKALFRFNIIFPMLDASLPRGERSRMVQQICAKEYRIPHSKKTSVSEATVWKWYHAYLEKGTIDSLAPSGRSDKGRRRTITIETEQELVRRYREKPGVPVKYLVDQAIQDGVFGPDDTISIGAIYQLIRKEKRGYEPTQKDRRAYRAPSINDMWQSDAMHGPKVLLPSGSTITAKLFVCLDNKSRLVCYAAWYPAETTDCYLDCLWKAFRLRGLPRKIYVDNGSAFRDDRLRLGCASLGVQISYAAPYKPQGKGAVERWNRTVRQQFLSTLPSTMLTLEELNIRFAKWIDLYNHRPHSSLEESSPLQCYLAELKAIRTAPENLPLHFRRSDTRVVGSDRTIRFMGKILQVPIGYAGRKIGIRWFDHDPLHTCEGFFEERSLGMLPLVDREANYRAKRRGQLS
jgi:transposase InsO family protein